MLEIGEISAIFKIFRKKVLKLQVFVKFQTEKNGYVKPFPFSFVEC